MVWVSQTLATTTGQAIATHNRVETDILAEITTSLAPQTLTTPGIAAWTTAFPEITMTEAEDQTGVASLISETSRDRACLETPQGFFKALVFPTLTTTEVEAAVEADPAPDLTVATWVAWVVVTLAAVEAIMAPETSAETNKIGTKREIGNSTTKETISS